MRNRISNTFSDSFPSDQPASTDSPTTCKTLQCVEVWGGNAAVDTEVRATGMDAWIWSQSADGGVGGDVYLASMCACAEISRYFVADVTGHGPTAAAWARRLRQLMRRHINTPDQTRLAQSLNQEFLRLASLERLATAVIATFLPATRDLILCNAGHPRPLWYDASTQRWDFLPSLGPAEPERYSNLPLGIIPGTTYLQYAVRLGLGDLVLIYTDGVTEARDKRGCMLEENGLLDSVSTISVHRAVQFMAHLRDGFERRLIDASLRDDATLLLLSPNGERPPKLSVGERIQATARMLGLLTS